MFGLGWVNAKNQANYDPKYSNPMYHEQIQKGITRKLESSKGKVQRRKGAKLQRPKAMITLKEMGAT